MKAAFLALHLRVVGRSILGVAGKIALENYSRKGVSVGLYNIDPWTFFSDWR